ncbi:hypothetical protein, partial [Nocardia abscessus]|uniref:hypothetical protein n=1 Tax=Nocardia abscessus TaxID=120957 RepID=UPI002455955D
QRLVQRAGQLTEAHRAPLGDGQREHVGIPTLAAIPRAAAGGPRRPPAPPPPPDGSDAVLVSSRPPAVCTERQQCVAPKAIRTPGCKRICSSARDGCSR